MYLNNRIHNEYTWKNRVGDEKMKKILLIGIVTTAVIATMLSGCMQNETGTLVLQITDAPGDLNITHANVTISRVEVHKNVEGEENITAYWYTVVNYNESKTFDLIEIMDVKEFLGSEELPAGIYTQIRLIIDSCIITVNGTEYTCKLPTETIKLVSQFELTAGETTTLTLDFDVYESVLQEGVHGIYEYIFQPVIIVIQE
ncbi:MAG: hypothetical protein BV458_04115 [Thermoplasmata archaeon M9B2D]|nr:MAG: hypothetical protein BV458_04115 [Thermoplasmata archaeon M9B2D]